MSDSPHADRVTKPFYITTAIDYPNGAPHIGHAYEKVLADVIARYRRLRGDKVYFLTGVDQHGQKMQQTADAIGIPVAELARRNTRMFLALWEKLGITYDGWAETTSDLHVRCVQSILVDLHRKGGLYKKSSLLHYSVRQEQYLTDKDRSSDGAFGPEWGEVLELHEENWWFRLSEHAAWLRNAVSSGTFRIIPEFRRAEVLNAVNRAAGTDLCISRPKERLRWGIEIPFDPGFVTYVWFDALINYISFAGYAREPGDNLPDFDLLWPADAHVIGKDILVPAHSIYWPCMLHAIGVPDEKLPALLVHGWWNIKGEKMSKTLGNVVDPDQLAGRFGVDALRYYLVRDITTGKDSDFDAERLVNLYNTELANDLGNLLNRSLNMTRRFLGAELPETQYDDPENRALRESLAEAASRYLAAMDGYDPAAALEALRRHVVHCNGYVERRKPWELARNEEARDPLASVLRHLCESCAHLAVLFAPVLPDASAAMLAQLRAASLAPPTTDHLAWGLLPPGHKTGKPKPVFPRIELE